MRRMVCGKLRPNLAPVAVAPARKRGTRRRRWPEWCARCFPDVAAPYATVVLDSAQQRVHPYVDWIDRNGLIVQS